jgi:G3E family GTPase
VLDLRGFNLNAKLDIDPDFLKEDEHATTITTMITRASTATTLAPARARPRAPPPHDDDVKSFVFRSERAFDPAKLEDFLGAIVNIYGPRMLRYKGVLS